MHHGTEVLCYGENYLGQHTLQTISSIFLLLYKLHCVKKMARTGLANLGLSYFGIETTILLLHPSGIMPDLSACNTLWSHGIIWIAHLVHIQKN